MSTENKFSSKKWCKLLQVEVLDPDGWNRSAEDFNKEWVSKKITLDEFKNRLFNSTVNDLSKVCIQEKHIEELQRYLFRYGESIKLNKEGYLTGFFEDNYIIFSFKISKEKVYNDYKETLIFYIKTWGYSDKVYLNNLSELLGCLKGIEYSENQYKKLETE